MKTSQRSQLIEQLFLKNGESTDAELAAALNITPAYMSLLKAGLRNPSMRVVGRILARHPDLSPYHLLDLQAKSPRKAVA